VTEKALQIISIVAIVTGPVLALFAQRVLDHLREKRKRKHVLFYTLTTSRAIPLSLAHVQALNAIEIEFYPRKGSNKRVIDAWRIYSDHLNTTQPLDPVGGPAWDLRRQDLMVDLLYEMAQSLGYDFDKVMLKRNAYHPEGLGKIDAEQAALRQAAVKVFEGKDSLRIHLDQK
jgi:hypothetical protein